MDYKQAGVDVDAGDALVDWLKATQPAKSPHQDRLVSGIGGFAALFRADFPDIKEPCLVSCTDGVGTKVKLAVHFDRYREVAQDLVAMCVNDLVCSGARPLFFLDYYATGQLQLAAAKEFLDGVRTACHASDCALIGGETAEMPGVYGQGDFDCAGFAVGVVDRAQAWGADKVKVGHRLLGVSSSGFHSNGFSLLRKVFAEDLEKWQETLLTPTALYVNLASEFRRIGGVAALSHVTGGGLDNVPRVLPKGTIAALKAWPVPQAFLEVKRRTGMSWDKMVRTLNCGLGLVAVVEESKLDLLKQAVLAQGFKAYDLGRVEAGAKAEAEADWSLDFSSLEEA